MRKLTVLLAVVIGISMVCSFSVKAQDVQTGPETFFKIPAKEIKEDIWMPGDFTVIQAYEYEEISQEEAVTFLQRLSGNIIDTHGIESDSSQLGEFGELVLDRISEVISAIEESGQENLLLGTRETDGLLSRERYHVLEVGDYMVKIEYNLDAATQIPEGPLKRWIKDLSSIEILRVRRIEGGTKPIDAKYITEIRFDAIAEVQNNDENTKRVAGTLVIRKTSPGGSSSLFFPSGEIEGIGGDGFKLVNY